MRQDRVSFREGRRRRLQNLKIGKEDPDMAKLAKKDAISYVKAQTDITQDQATKAVNSLIDYIKDRVAAGDEVTLTGFGTFSAVKAAARVATDPNTKAKIDVPAKMRPKFKAGKDFKDKVESK